MPVRYRCAAPLDAADSSQRPALATIRAIARCWTNHAGGRRFPGVDKGRRRWSASDSWQMLPVAGLRQPLLVREAYCSCHRSRHHRLCQSGRIPSICDDSFFTSRSHAERGNAVWDAPHPDCALGLSGRGTSGRGFPRSAWERGKTSPQLPNWRLSRHVTRSKMEYTSRPAMRITVVCPLVSSPRMLAADLGR